MSRLMEDMVPYGIHRNFAKLKQKIKLLKLKKCDSIENFGIQIEEGEECVILGNGPSLKESLSDNKVFDFIKNKKKFCVNNSVLTEEFQQLKPDYIIFMDPYFWDNKVIEPFLSKYLKMAEILSNVDWKIKIFLPSAASSWNFFIDVPQKNNNVEIIYINIKFRENYPEELKFLEYRQNKSMPRVQNVLVACIYAAINIGFKNTYIFGADHSWQENMYIDDNNIPYVCDVHYFEDKNNATILPFYKDGECTQIFDMAELFMAFSYHFAAYKELERYAYYMGKKIYNASAKSFIDAFERIKVNEIKS